MCTQDATTCSEDRPPQRDGGSAREQGGDGAGVQLWVQLNRAARRESGQPGPENPTRVRQGFCSSILHEVMALSIASSADVRLKCAPMCERH
jgi:hypothetical protein